MEGKSSERDDLTAFLREVVPPPGVEVQVYRRRQDDPKKWKYLGSVELGIEIELDYLESVSARDLEGLIPNTETKRLWGGGAYQFRFFWRDEEGRKKQKRSQNGDIWGLPRPKR